MNLAVKDALIAAGGCTHTPEPQQACSTCGRPPASWAKKIAIEGSVPYEFRATLLNGNIIDRCDVLSTANVPLDEVTKIEVTTSDRRVPSMAITVDPRKGERLRMFTKRVMKMNVRSGDVVRNLSIPVFEVILNPEQPDRFVRLYLHPDRPILSTEDLNF